MTKIYFAAPLHGEYERHINMSYTAELRANGFQVYLPQEHGIWEPMVQEEMAKGVSEEVATKVVRIRLYRADKEAVEKCDCVIACGTHEDGSPSEGMIWEMGYAAGMHKQVYLINPEGDSHWDYNLMPEFGSIVFKSLQEVIEYLKKEEFI